MAIGGTVSNCVVDPIGFDTVLTFEIDDALERGEYTNTANIEKDGLWGLCGGHWNINRRVWGDADQFEDDVKADIYYRM